MLRDTWPLELVEDPARQPRIVETASEFLREVLVGDHLEDFVLLPNGVELLDLGEKDCLPTDLREALHGCNSVAQFLDRLRVSDSMLDKYKAGIEYVDHTRQQSGVLPKERQNLRKRINTVMQMVEEKKADPDLLYVAEMRLLKQAPHPIGGEKVKTLCRRDVKDVLGPYAAWTLYWDRHDEGLFVGNNRSGKGIHIDQVLWSNVGKNWRGYKLVAALPVGEVSCEVCKQLDDELFSPPLAPRQEEALRRAAKVVLLRPGDVYLFSGGVTHTVLCVSDEMAVSSYESIVTLSPRHVEHFLSTASISGPYRKLGCMPKCELRDLMDECLDQLEEAGEQVTEKGGPELLPGPMKAESPIWRTLLSELQSDETLRDQLRVQYVQAIRLCEERSGFMRRSMPRKAIKAAVHLGGPRTRNKLKDKRGCSSCSRSDSRSRSRSRSDSRSTAISDGQASNKTGTSQTSGRSV